MREVLGIDVGATGMKGAIVDVVKGELISERIKYPTPHPATPQAMLDVLKKLVADFNWKGKQIGMGFPAIIKNGIALSASNIDKTWLDFPVEGFLSKKLKCPVTVINDADAAGMAELHFGIAGKKNGLVLLLTLGTGIGSATFFNKKLIPNTELGHLKYKDGVIEDYASNKARESGDLSYKTWGKELNKVLQHIEFVLSPDHIILGGGISKKFSKYSDYIKTDSKTEPAQLLNFAGIIGAAMAGARGIQK